MPGSWWNVAALGKGGAPLALSELRRVSPGGDAGPDPNWHAKPEETESTVEGAEQAGQSDGELVACDLLTVDDLADTLGGTWTAEGTVHPQGRGSSCKYSNGPEQWIDAYLGPKEIYDPEGWNGGAA